MTFPPRLVLSSFIECVHCMDKPIVVRDSIVLMSSTPSRRSDQSEWLLSCLDVCLATLTPQRPIVTKNMCFYGCKADLHHAPFLAVAMRLRLNCYDDLFVPTDMVWSPIQVFTVQCMFNLSI